MRRVGTRTALAVGLTGACLLPGAILPASAPAAFKTGSAAYEYVSNDGSVRDEWFDKTVDARAEVIRIFLDWRTTTTGQPADPADPADPAYGFSALDAAVEDASARELDVLLTLYNAPDFAEGPNRPDDAAPGTWKPDPRAYAAFARAVALRYSGSFSDLPRVRYYQAWNEPNIHTFLNPQWEGGSPVGAEHYRGMLNAFDRAVHDVRPDNVVITGGTAPFGDPRGGLRMRPLRFWREVMCLKKQGGKLEGASCPVKASFDILAHHPINTSGGPTYSATHPDDSTTPDFKHVRRTLRVAERKRRVAGGRHQLWATEIWWESDPPDSFRGVNLERHARWTQQALYLLWRQGAKAVINLSIRDGDFDPDRPLDTIEAGLYFNDSRPKPALTAFRFPLVVDRKSGRSGLAWGKAPAAGKVKIQRRRGDSWRTVDSERVSAGEVFTAKVPLEARGDRYRGRLGSDKSLVWEVRH